MSFDNIVRCRIHPGIGVARVGNSPTEFFIGPEWHDAIPNPEGGFKDASGRIKRQVARFRIFGLNADGQVVKELTTEDAEITWTVHVANKKAAWYCFDQALDIPGAKPEPRRNPAYAGDRRNLIIDPGPRSVTGRHARARFDGGKFLGVEVPLGEIRTDADGRLLFFGGLGNAASISNLPPDNGLNNTGWYDDVSDGPISAEVKIGGYSVPVLPAWVIVAPPNYAPGIRTAVTMYDVVYEVATKRWLTPPAEVSFTRHIYPIFERFCNLQWVNEGFYLKYGWGSPDDFLSASNLAKLSNNVPECQPIKQYIFDKFRDPDYVETQPDALPPMYGDGFNWPPDKKNPRNWLTLPRLQYGWLKQWAQGYFKGDWKGYVAPLQRLEDLPINEQPHALDQAALEHCLGGAFHPGCEATWPMRHLLLYDGPFRIKPRPANQPERDYGKRLTPDEALAEDGPLNGSGPGDVTRWMAVPWQRDTASCGSGYLPGVNPFLPTFWPARAPNQVLPEQNYKQALDKKLSKTQRMKYFSLREDWLRDFANLPSWVARENQFIRDWSKVGILAHRTTPPGNSDLPPSVFVEVDNQLQQPSDNSYLLINPWRHR